MIIDIAKSDAEIIAWKEFKPKLEIGTYQTPVIR